MESWKSMYLIIWISFLQILLILFAPTQTSLEQMATIGIHVVIGLAVLGLAFSVYRGVRQSACPDRIKRITRTTRNLTVFQGVLGIALALGIVFSLGSLYAAIVGFLHVANALAIITQASSSATAYDMWEEKEFQTPAPAQQPMPAL